MNSSNVTINLHSGVWVLKTSFGPTRPKLCTNIASLYPELRSEPNELLKFQNKPSSRGLGPKT